MNVKKTIAAIVFSVLAFYVNAQVAIGKDIVNGESTILDFDDSFSNMRGLILPAVESVSTGLGEETMGLSYLTNPTKNSKCSKMVLG